MTRIIEHSETGPIAVPKDSVPGTHLHVCRCGLSKTLPLCDGTHRIVRKETPGTLVGYARVGGTLVPESVHVVRIDDGTRDQPASTPMQT